MNTQTSYLFPIRLGQHKGVDENWLGYSRSKFISLSIVMEMNYVDGDKWVVEGSLFILNLNSLYWSENPRRFE